MKAAGTRMSKEIPELKFLLSEVEKSYGRSVNTTTDFEALSVVIERDVNERLSASTLKRLWGYVSNNNSPSLTTLNILARFVGKKDFRTFCEDLKKQTLFESSFFTSHFISASDLQPGNAVRIGWNPDRMVCLEYLGDFRFRVMRNMNSSLREGDEFDVSSFFLGFPLFIPRILRNGEYTPSYIAGSVNGLTTLELL